MSRRLIAALAAILLAAVGTVLIVTYVGSADQRAMAGLDPIQVLVVTQPVPEGTAAEDLSQFVALETVPAAALAPDAVSDLDQVAGKVAETDLVTGEQLIGDRFVEPEALIVDGEVEIPAGMHQVTIQLERVRVLGGNLVPGDTVGIFVSILDESAQTHLVAHKVLVARVQGGIAPPAATDDSEAAAAEPLEVVMVTLVLDAAAAEEIVWAAERAGIWLSLEDAEATESGTRIVNAQNVFE